MSILNNARDSIIIGIEDYKLATDGGDEKRFLSSTRNLFAGILLLFKHKLSKLSPIGTDEVLIKKRIRPHRDGEKLTWKGQGGNTVDFDQIKERSKSLGINVEWKRLDRIKEYRNNIEHYYAKDSADSVRTMISDCFLVINNFVTNELSLDPQELLGKDTWDTLVSIKEVHEAEKEACNTKLRDDYDWKTHTAYKAAINYYCDDCFSDLISVNDDSDFYCKTCGEIYDSEKFIEDALEHEFSYTIRDIQQGAEPELFRCPDCDKETYTRGENICHLCGITQELRCIRCGDDISELLECGGVCYYCRSRADKD